MFSLPHLIILTLLTSLAKAETFGPNYPSFDETTYQPNLAVVIAILGVMFVLTILILVYAKLCHRAAFEPARPTRVGPSGPTRAFSGIEKAVIESLPFFRFSSLKGSKDGLECAVCLSGFEESEILRLLPKCRHAFHVGCIDHWLESHATCPLCRDRVTSDDLKLVEEKHGSGSDRVGLEMFVQREERNDASFRGFHKHNHKMVVSGFVFNNRWSDLRCSDLVSLRSEMLNDTSSSRFDVVGGEGNDVVLAPTSRELMGRGGQRSASDMNGLSRNGNWGLKSKSVESSEKRVRKVWLPIANRTVHWFANREHPHTQRLDIV